ncbi:MAG: hypothetical protein KDK23_08895, partial [Leptospiraceae bacterium]|nr:hypothetical protein [Leptospiraceae bacterium]
MKTCYGYDASLQLHNSGRTMPDLLLIATPLFNENGACWPAANSQEESRAYVHTQMNRIRGAYRFVYDGYGYAGSPELKQLHSEYE